MQLRSPHTSMPAEVPASAPPLLRVRIPSRFPGFSWFPLVYPLVPPGFTFPCAEASAPLRANPLPIPGFPGFTIPSASLLLCVRFPRAGGIFLREKVA